MKSDLLRCLILAKVGGVYSDIDAVALRSIDTGIPKQYHHLTSVIVSIEVDRLDGSNWGQLHADIQFCHWIIAVAPKHPVLQRMVTKVIKGL